ncbi:MAG: class I SAM-dependent methyltransferase [Candidatus Moduliflexus flocculans]|nr:class I SAM-dependent methyltransferase [Candidatus Moduliflexus flocculans]
MIKRAKEHHPELTFIPADAHDLSAINETFDIIILSDLVNDLWDVQRALEQIKRLSTPHTRVILNFYSRLWQVHPRLGAGAQPCHLQPVPELAHARGYQISF